MKRWIADDLPALTGDPDYVLMGDFNAYGKEDPIAILEAGGFVSQVQRFLGTQTYDYVFDGAAGSLSNVLANAAVSAQITGLLEWHSNADEPSAFDYNDYNQSSAFQPNEWRAADHDPLLVGGTLSTATAVPATPRWGAGAATLLRRAVEFLCSLALLLAPWHGLDSAFCAGYCRLANALGFQRELDSGLSMRLEPATRGDLESARAHVGWHAMLRVEAPSTQRVTRLGFNTCATSYVPGAAFVAFVVASRAWKRTRAAVGVLVGALVTLAFSGLALTLSTVRFVGLRRVGGVELGDTARALLDTAFLAWIVPPGMAYAAPLLAGSLMLWLTRSRRVETPRAFVS